MTLPRRTFLLGGLGAVALPALLRAAPAMLPVIDTHQHLWDFAVLTPPWLTPGEAGNPLARSFTPADYAAATAGLNVVKSVYMEVAVSPADTQKEADYVVGLCEAGKTSMAAAVVGGFPGTPGFAAFATQYKGHKFVKGFRKTLHGGDTPAGHCLTKEFVKDIQLVGDMGLSFDLCVRPAELPDAAKLVARCPGTRFVLDHCGNASVAFTDAERDAWRKAVDALAALPNVVGKLSGFIVNGGPKAGGGQYTAADLAPTVDAVVEAFGTGRVVFGGDWPVVLRVATYKEWLTLFREIIAGRPAADQRKILHDNAAAFYGL